MQQPNKTPAQPHSPFQGFLPFFWLALACLAGIFLADRIDVPAWVWAAGCGLSLLLLVLAKTLPKSHTLTHYLRKWTGADRRLPGAVLALLFFAAAWRFAALQPEITPEFVAYYNGCGPVQLTGVVMAPPDPRDSTLNLTVAVDTLSISGADAPAVPVSGLVLLQVSPGGDWAYGDRLLVYGILQAPSDSADFSYRDYLARQNIFSLMPYARVQRLGTGAGNPVRAFLYRVRYRGYETLQTLFRSPESDLLAGILLGWDQGLSPQLQEAFRRTGTTHIIAISGFNIAILAGLFTGIATRLFGRKWGALAALVGITGYTVLVGAEAAVVRAAIMGSLGVFGGMFGRRQNGLNSLGLAALGMMLADPNLPWDVGFQLSAAATLGLVLYAQPLEERFLAWVTRWVPEEQAQRWAGPIAEIFLFTIIAQAMTLPLMAYHFEGVSWLALFANPLILPVQTLVMVLGGLALLVGMVLPGLGQVLAVVALPFVTYTIRVVSFLGQLPFGEVTLSGFHVLWLGIYYGLMFFFTLFPRPSRQAFYHKVLTPELGALVLFGLVIFTWNRVLTTPDGDLHLTLLDAEGTVLIQTPEGNAVLVGGGSRPSELNQALGQILPAGHRRLDAVVVGSTYREDLNALTGLRDNVPVHMAWWNADPETNQTTRSLYQQYTAEQVPLAALENGQVLALDEDIELRVLWTGERGAVLWLAWEDFTALLPTGKVEENWLSVPEAPDVILLPDGLEADELPLTVINAWQPVVVLCPLAEEDLSLQGEAELAAALVDYPLVSTAEHGWVRVTTDGTRLWVESEQ